MGVKLLDMYVDVTADTTKTVPDAVSSIQKDGSSIFGRVGGVLGKGLVVGLGAALVGATAVTAAAGAAAGSILSKGLDRALDIQDAEAKLRGLKLDAGGVTEVMNDALASVKGTAFGLGDAATIAASALAAGVKMGPDLTRTLKLTADAATIAGAPLSEIGAMWNKVAAGGKLTTDVVQQFQDRGVPVLQYVASQYHVTAAAAQQMVTDGKVSFADFQNAMETNLGGAAQSSGDTARGAFDNVNAALGRLGVGFVAGAVNAAPDLFKSMAAALDRAKVALQPLADKFDEFSSVEMYKLAAWIDQIDFGVMLANIELSVNTAENRFIIFRTRIEGYWQEIRSMFSGNTVTPNMSGVGAALGNIRDIVGPLLPIAGQAAKAIGKIGGSVGDLLTAGIGLLPPILDLATKALTSLSKHPNEIKIIFALLVAGFIASRSAALLDTAASLSNGLAKIINSGATRANASAQIALANEMRIARGETAMGTLQLTIQNAQSNIAYAKSLLLAGATGVKSAATAVATGIQWAFNAAMDAGLLPILLVAAAIAALIVVIILIVTHWSEIVAFIEDVWAGAMELARQVIANVVDWIAANWPLLITIILGPLGAIIALVITHFSEIQAFIGGVIGWIIAAWTTGWNAVYAAGAFIVGAIIAYVSGVLGGIIFIVQAIGNGVVAAWRGAWGLLTGVVSGVVGAVVGAANGLVSGVTGVISRVLDIFAGLGGRINGAIGDVGGMLSGIGGKIIDGLVSGIKGAFGKVKDVLSNLTSLIPDWKGPAELDAVLLVNNGGLIMGGLMDGIGAQIPALRKQLGGITADIPAMTISRGSAANAAMSPSLMTRTDTTPASVKTVNNSVVINEANDPLGTSARVQAELTKFGK
ncbi:MAG: tape measure protein [Frankiales bacterium]|nr:tape measure protein [Frankiales bacterium]